ncbi:MAG: adenosylcobinamide-GDP ribazoletransferase, partial [Hyphomicrobium sp.]
MNLRGPILAFQFLTRLPMPSLERLEEGELSRAAIYFPFVGLVIGAILAAVMAACVSHGSWPAAIAVLIGWVWITGALHLDGLGDVADAFGAAHGNPDRFFEVLKDPHAGSFAIVAISLQLMAKLVLLAHLQPAVSTACLVLVPALARWFALVLVALLPSLKPGLSRDYGWDVSTVGVVLWGAALSVASLVWAPVLLAVLVLLPLVWAYWRWRLGGITGDCLGATLVVTEVVLLAAAAF